MRNMVNLQPETQDLNRGAQYIVEDLLRQSGKLTHILSII